MKKETISPLQIAMILANLLLTASLITLPQILTQIAGQNAWLTPLLVFPVIILMILFGLGKGTLFLQTLDRKDDIWSKGFYSVLLIFLVLLYIRDLRAFVDFISSSLLPKTPIEVIAILLTLTCLYISIGGLEVIARITVIQFIVFIVIVIFAPLLLLNEIDLKNLTPIVRPGVLSDLGKSSVFMLPWMGEVVVLFLLLTSISGKDKAKVKKAAMYGTGLGFFLITLLIALDIAVLGSGIVSKATYPNFIMIQEINITDFLDRLDLVIVTVWMPCFISKITLTLYCIFRILVRLKVTKTNLLFAPVSLLLGILSIILFESNAEHLKFSFYSFTIIGLVLEVLIVGLFFFMRTKKQKELKNQHST
ncbi:GerAB/ArcD/ProY family transporter [Bacillus pinisoli]|uniref:GerAB/ArcD/ProY family transporter n=1 Tax=Bacillus pinisoli TaxID=2901866 RepID=UPI001FF51F76|nr:GerAB/ArcD/ProY family transporter [Bacillus pinisoli]